MFLKQIFARETKLRQSLMLVLRTSNFQGSTIRPIVPRHKTLLSLLFTTKFSSVRHLINHIELFSTFLDESLLNVKFKKENEQNPLNTISFVYFFISSLVYRKCFTESTIHPGIFLGQALWADSVSPRMNIIASRDQLKPVRIRKNLVVNYNL